MRSMRVQHNCAEPTRLLDACLAGGGGRVLLGLGGMHQDAQLVVHGNPPPRRLGKVQRGREVCGADSGAPATRGLASSLEKQTRAPVHLVFIMSVEEP